MIPPIPELNCRLITYLDLEDFTSITDTNVSSGLAVTAESNKRERTSTPAGAPHPREARVGSSPAPAEHVEEQAEAHDDEDDAIFGGDLETIMHSVSYFHIGY